jgi:hypothetical protein
MHLMSRRNALRIAGPGAALLAGLVRSTRAEAQPAGKRIIFWFKSNGTIPSAFWPQGSETGFTMGSILKPLEPWRSNLIVAGGLGFVGMRQGGGAPGSRGGGHQGPGCLLTGTENSAENGLATHTNVSCDQVIARTMSTPWKSMELAASDPRKDMLTGKASYKLLSATGPGQAVIPEVDPQKAFDRYFGRVMLRSDPGGARPDPALEALRAQDRSVLDFVRTNLTGLQARLGAREKAKIDAHLTAIRELEAALSAPSIAVSGACTLPGKPGALDPFANANFPMIQKLQADLMVQAMACGLTRVGVLTWEGGQGRVVFNWLGLGTEHHELSHADKTEPINVWYAQRLADMLAAMQKIPEGGGTMLDNTIVVAFDDIAVGSHHASPIPYVIVAGKNTGLRTGRFVNFGGKCQNMLFASMIQLMGANPQDWGKAAQFGTLPGLT